MPTIPAIASPFLRKRGALAEILNISRKSGRFFCQGSSLNAVPLARAEESEAFSVLVGKSDGFRVFFLKTAERRAVGGTS